MDFALLGIKYDRSQTFIKGASRAPEIIRNILPKIETYVSGIELTDRAFFDDLGNITPRDNSDLINQIFVVLSRAKGFPLIIGGDHSVTYPCAKTLDPGYVVVVDAHPDCEEGEGHDSVVRRLIEKFGKDRVLLYGVRSMSKKEKEFIEKNEVKIVSLRDLERLKGNVYLSIDLDILDPSIMPLVGNPEPDGLKFGEVVDIVKILADRLVGIDFVEYTPTTISSRDVYTSIVGKLIYASIAEIIKAKE